MASRQTLESIFLDNSRRAKLIWKPQSPPRYHPAGLFRMASTWSKLTGSLGRLRQGQKPPEDPRSFPSRGFSLIDQSQKVEEEELPDYVADRFYPVRLGRVFHGRYKTIAKLGFGSSSTIWLARDLSDHRYVALKVYVHTSRFHRELPLYKDMSPKRATKENAGRKNIRQLLDSFEIDGPHGQHVALVFQPAQMSLRDMKLVFRKEGGFDKMFVKGAVEELLKAPDFLHSEAHVVHTDIHPGNLLLGLNDDSLLRPLKDQEFSSPVARKVVSPDRTIYLSRLIRPKPGPMLLSDFGEARSGPGPHTGDIMPIQCRAPEAIIVNRNSGAAPLEFLRRNSERAADFWNENGDWLGLAPIPPNRTLEELETRLKDPSRFIAFLRRVLTWVPEERPTAKEFASRSVAKGTNISTAAHQQAGPFQGPPGSDELAVLGLLNSPTAIAFQTFASLARIGVTLDELRAASESTCWLCAVLYASISSMPSWDPNVPLPSRRWIDIRSEKDGLYLTSIDVHGVFLPEPPAMLYIDGNIDCAISVLLSLSSASGSAAKGLRRASSTANFSV
ncbi:hypothetical protein MRS44_010966 [Fusarium solani]|uniref:uncharacterized protein n=1 Tax=Fusarium solani TaxID=169388 RepID=UPI0032C461B5|nr:hypothetical protein MRS44_010966 [Fusarium solani]